MGSFVNYLAVLKRSCRSTKPALVWKDADYCTFNYRTSEVRHRPQHSIEFDGDPIDLWSSREKIAIKFDLLLWLVCYFWGVIVESGRICISSYRSWLGWTATSLQNRLLIWLEESMLIIGRVSKNSIRRTLSTRDCHKRNEALCAILYGLPTILPSLTATLQLYYCKHKKAGDEDVTIESRSMLGVMVQQRRQF